jgi:hypothetical protein
MARNKTRRTMKRARRRTPPPTPRQRAPRRNAAPKPDLGNTIASVAGGGGGAILGGLLANRGWDPATVALAMTVGGGLGAYTLDGGARIAANGLAAAGAGQLALALLADQTEASAPTPAPKPRANAASLPPGAIESAFERARRRLAMDDDFDRFDDAIDVGDPL